MKNKSPRNKSPRNKSPHYEYYTQVLKRKFMESL